MYRICEIRDNGVFEIDIDHNFYIADDSIQVGSVMELRIPKDRDNEEECSYMFKVIGKTSVIDEIPSKSKCIYTLLLDENSTDLMYSYNHRQIKSMEHLIRKVD